MLEFLDVFLALFPAVAIAADLAKEFRGEVVIVEPHTDDLPHAFNGLQNASLYPLGGALEKAQIVVLLVDHRDFRELDTDHLKDKTVFDTRGIWR